MQQRLLAVSWIMLVVAPLWVQVQARQSASGNQFEAIKPPADDLARYGHRVAAFAGLSKSEQSVASQLLASSEAELGLYSEAVRDFPLRSRLPHDLDNPRRADWQAVDALEAITSLAANHRIVMINEAHHDAHTRELTLALLPRLRALGFNYFAAEALDARDALLATRGYPVAASGSEYLHEPLYGDMVRQAIKLGFVIVPYDVNGQPQDREDGEARNLYERVLARDPAAKLFIHAGYAHIDKQPGRLGTVRPMAMQLKKLSGIAPLSIDQTDIREENPRSEAMAYDSFRRALRKFETMDPILTPAGTGPGDRPERSGASAYDRIVSEFAPDRAIVLLRKSGSVPWSARPGTYDLNVILPPANAVPSDYTGGPISLRLDGSIQAVLPPANRGHRPQWLALGGLRIAVPIDTGSCARRFPCLVEAHYMAESSDAVAADRYLFLQDAKNVLYLRPGAYRLRTVDASGQVSNEQVIRVATP